MAVSVPAIAQPAPVEIARTELAPGIYQFTVASDGYVEQLNSVAIVTDRDVLVFDTTTRPSTARTILEEIRKITPKPVRFVANSHWHPDHWSGNEVFAAADPDLEIIATEKERDFMLNFSAFYPSYIPKGLAAQEKSVAEQFATNKRADGSPLTPELKRQIEREMQQIRDMAAEQLKVKRIYPTLTYTDQLVLRHGGREFRFMSVTGDAAATTVLYLPKEKILITGDTVSYPLPYFTPPLSEHAKSIRQLAALDATTIVPGHGPAFHDKSYMLMEAELFEEVVRQTQAALRGGAVTIDDVQAKVELSKFRDRFSKGDPDLAGQFDTAKLSMVRKAYIELRDGKEIR
ncbi:MBL fold metallo-hydrolase [Sphingomonas sp. URHD0057]|uniref:MBL fold metallo-hydrolase n=1 Tax=Sphingomonas sp. URHD0057 TaxID=1380389 RepID=UPI0004920FDD|nr:MBL fold metallo-hydrolase [Sphingomonas sp. URHD0057]